MYGLQEIKELNRRRVEENRLKRIKTLLERNPDGITLNLKGEVFKGEKGYAVGLTNNKVSVLTEDYLKQLLENAQAFSTELFIGGWRDDQGDWYVDLTTIVKRKSDALTLGRLFNQKAVYSFKDKKSVYI